MGETALVRHMIAKVSMDTGNFKKGADSVRKETQRLGKSTQSSFSRGVSGIELLGKTLRGGAVVGGMAAIAYKAIQIKDNFDSLGETLSKTPGLLDGFNRGVLSVLQALPLIGESFDISKEAIAAEKMADASFQIADALKEARRYSDGLFLTGDDATKAKLEGDIDAKIDNLTRIQRAALAIGEVGQAGTATAEIAKLKAFKPQAFEVSQFNAGEKYIQTLKDEAAQLSMTAEEYRAYSIKKQNLNSAQAGEAKWRLKEISDLKEIAAAGKEADEMYKKINEDLDMYFLHMADDDEFSKRRNAGIREAEKAQKAFNDEANSIFEQTRTPAENQALEMQKLIQHLEDGTISANTFARAAAGMTDTSSSLPPALQKGTQAAFSAVNNRGQDEQKKKLEEIAAIEKDALEFEKNKNFPLLQRVFNRMGTPVQL